MNLLFNAFLFACGAYLAHRARRLRLGSVSFLALFFILLGGEFVLSILYNVGLPRPATLDAIVLQCVAVSFLLFTQKTFFVDKRSPFKALLVVVFAVGALNTIAGIYEDVTLDSAGARMLRTVLIWAELAIASTWQTWVSLGEYRHLRDAKAPIEPFVLKRYLIFGIASLLFIPTLVIDVVGTWLDIAMDTGYTLTGIAITSILVVYVLLNLLVWIAPGWFKAWLNKGTDGRRPAAVGFGEGAGDMAAAGEAGLPGKPLTNRETYAIIEYIGNSMAERIEQTPGAVKGLLLLAIQQHQTNAGTLSISYAELKDVFQKEVRDILYRIGTARWEEIVQDMIRELTEKQSLLTMISI